MNITIHKAQLSNLVEVSKLFDEYRVFYKQKSDLSLALDFLTQRQLRPMRKLKNYMNH